MNLTKAGLVVVLLSFVAFTAWAVATGGTFSEVSAAFTANPWTIQVTIDLILALSMVCVWMWTDARRRGKNPVPWVVATALTGSIAPLTYLLLRLGSAAHQDSREQPANAAG